MPITRVYSCPSCHGEFSFMHHPVNEPPPRYCPLCGYDTHAAAQEESVPHLTFSRAVTAPHIARPVGKSVDGYVRAMEEGEDHRVNMAREMGLDKQDAEAIRVGPLRDGHEGDMAVAPVNNAVSQAMEAQKGRFGFVGDPATGQQYAAAAHTGPYAHAGSKAMGMVQSIHAANVSATVASGRKG